MDTPLNYRHLRLLAMLFGVLVNLAPGLPAIHWNLPIYLDAIGTITLTLLCGWELGATVGVISSFVGGFTNPHMPYFAFTHVTIAAVTGGCARQGGFRSVCRTALSGIVIALAAAVVSAPAVAIAFNDDARGQLTFAHFYQATLEQWRSAFASRHFWVEPVDKMLSGTFAAAVIALLPKTFLNEIETPKSYLKINGFL